MEWWQQLGFSSEEEAIARGESKEVFERTRKNNNNFEMTLDDETELIRIFISKRVNTEGDG